MSDAARAADAVARASYGRLIGILSSRTHDIAAAEDALSEAFARALETWPQNGVPDNPDAWLLTAARHRLTDKFRRDARLRPEEDAPEPIMPETQNPIDDARLGLMFVCAHPAIDRALHTPLMLQTVLGFEAKQIASAFVTSPTAMAQRLVRAKAKIKANAIAFSVPEASEREPRLSAVLEAIYGAYALDWLENSDAFSGEAQYLAEILSHAMPDEAEILGLAALIAFGRARDSARIMNGVLVPVQEQNTDLWNDALSNVGTHYLTRASQLGQLGRFQLEAAIQSVHNARKRLGTTDWPAIAHLYDGLVRIAPSLGAHVARAAAHGQAFGAEVALSLLDTLSQDRVHAFQPYHATRAFFLAGAGQIQSARHAYDQAISLATDTVLRRYLEKARAQLPIL